jgi:drug/metabolite transporter (DMT)-like permease
MKPGDRGMADQKVLGALFGVSAGAIWAVEAVLGKVLFRSSTFLQVAATEAFFATVTAVTYTLVRRVPLNVNRTNISRLVVIGLVGTVFAPVMYFFGLTQTYAINATLIAHLQPFFVSILAFYFLQERLKRRDYLAGLLMIVAAFLITSRTFDNLANFSLGNVGDLTVLVATVSWALVAIPGKRLIAEASSVVIVSYRFLIASLVFLPLLLGVDQFAVHSLYQVLLGVLVGLGYIFYYEGLKRMEASHVALTELSAPFFTAVFAWHVLGEAVTPLQVVGAFLLLAGLYLLTYERPVAPSSR